MPRYVALLRAINVGGHTVKMDRLRKMFESLGFSEVQTFIASGNVIFRSSGRNQAALETRIETHLARNLGYDVATFIRSDKELIRIAEHNPFRRTSMDQGTLYVAFLKTDPGSAATKKLVQFRTVVDDFHIHKREVYWFCRTRSSDSEFSGAILEKTLQASATLRNSTTVRNLAEKCRL